MGKRLRADDTREDTDDSRSVSIGSPAKVQEVEVTLAATQTPRFQCLLPPHAPISFSSINEFDVHCIKEHTNRCSSCGKNFPSTHYLALHIDENHNPIREAKAAQGERTYGCFVDNCDRKCSTPQKRRLHLIDKHMFPRSYNFRIIDQGIDKNGSLLTSGQRRRLSSGTRSLSKVSPPLSTEASSIAESPPNASSTIPSTPSRSFSDMTDSDGVDSLEQSLSALRFVPPSVQARRRGKKLPA